MIETHNPEINVDELMARIREEVARQRAANSPSTPPPPHADIPAASVDWHRITASLHLAEQTAQVGAVVPGWARFGRVRRWLARLIARSILYLSSFITNQQKRFNVAVLTPMRALGEGLRNLESRFIEREGRLSGLEETLGNLRAAVSVLEQGQQAELQQLEGERVRREERIGELEQVVGSLQEAVSRLEQGQQAELRQLEGERVRREERIGELEQVVGGLQEAVSRLEQGQQEGLRRLEGELGRIKELERTLFQLKTNLILQERRITLLLEEARKRLPEPFDQQQLQVLADEGKHRLDALYVSFEDQFRGTRADIKERLRVYLPVLREAGIGTEQMPILDIGCGRGEWLELLRDEGLLARGVDINRILIAKCREHGFEVSEGDAIASLRCLPDARVGAVTGFHLIEHLPFDILITLLDETVRVLKPGGVAIFETPNPQNIVVGSCTFYLDPTHRNPIPSPMVQFLAEARGLCRVEIWNLHPFPEAWKVSGSELAARFNDFFYGPRDYAVLGWKA